MTQTYAIVIASPCDRNKLVAEILVDGKYVGQVVQERSDGVLEIELADASVNQEMVCRKIEVEVLLQALQAAKNRL